MTRDAVLRRALETIVFAAAMLVGAPGPVSAQNDGFRFFPFFDNNRRPAQQQWHQPWSWQPWQQQPPWQQQQQQAPQSEPPRQAIDYSKAPPPRKLESSPALRALVLGDAMGDWLGYGLEEAFGDNPEVAVVRKHHSGAGLIHGESRNAYDWPQAARDILANEPANFIVVMLGMADRQSIRDRPARSPKPTTPQTQRGNGPAEPALKGEEPSAEEAPPKEAPESTRGPAATYEFRSDKWAEAYAKRIDELIAVLKNKGVPVFWVGLASVRGSRATADMAYLNDLYRGRAEKAGIVFVDIWDGFVEENGNFSVQGPDFEGQTRRLRSGDGVYFTKAGARKLAHYVEREIRRAMLRGGAPVATPAPEEPQVPSPGARTGVAPTRPAAGPVVPLTVLTGGGEGLLGPNSSRALPADGAATKVLIKGEPLPSSNGRADDFSWPRREGGAPAVPGGAGHSDSPANEAGPAEPAGGGGQPTAAPSGKPETATPAKPAAPAADPPKLRRPALGRVRAKHGGGSAETPQRPLSPLADEAPRPPALIPR